MKEAGPIRKLFSFSGSRKRVNGSFREATIFLIAISEGKIKTMRPDIGHCSEGK